MICEERLLKEIRESGMCNDNRENTSSDSLCTNSLLSVYLNSFIMFNIFKKNKKLERNSNLRKSLR